jgi:hypothetical protein
MIGTSTVRPSNGALDVTDSEKLKADELRLCMNRLSRRL